MATGIISSAALVETRTLANAAATNLAFYTVPANRFAYVSLDSVSATVNVTYSALGVIIGGLAQNLICQSNFSTSIPSVTTLTSLADKLAWQRVTTAATFFASGVQRAQNPFRVPFATTYLTDGSFYVPVGQILLMPGDSLYTTFTGAGNGIIHYSVIEVEAAA